MQPQRLLIAMASITALLLCGCTQSAGKGAAGDPNSRLAVLGVSPPRVMLLDSQTLRETRSIPLRSASLDMAADGSGGLLTAQCGGPASASDSAVGLIRLAGAGVRYLRTAAIDPEAVAFEGGTGLTIHGEIRGASRAGTLIKGVGSDLPVLQPVELPQDTVQAAVGATRIWLLEGRATGGLVSSIDFVGERGSVVELGIDVRGIAVHEDLLYAVGVDGSGESRLLCWSPDKGQVVLEADVDIEPAMLGRIAVGDEWVAVAEYSWEDPGDPGFRVEIHGREDLQYLGSVAGLEGPCGLVVDSDVLWVACQGSSEVCRIDLESLKVDRRRSVGAAGFDLVDIELTGSGRQGDSKLAKAPFTGQKNRTR